MVTMNSINRQDNIAVVGCGGVGGYLAFPLLKYLEHRHIHSGSSSPKRGRLLFIDGDSFEKDNTTRQLCGEDAIGVNKAEWLRGLCLLISRGVVDIQSLDTYITPANIGDCLHGINTVFCCVDNHSTRKMLDDIRNTNIIPSFNVLINGGNETITGNVQVVDDKLMSLSQVHSEIDNPTDANPGLDCTQQADYVPQLAVVNNMVASMMLMQFMRYENIVSKPHEIYFNCATAEFGGHDRRKKK